MNKTNLVLTNNCPILLTPRSQQHIVHKSLHHEPIHHNLLLAKASKIFTLIAQLINKTNTDFKKFQKILSNELQNFEEEISVNHYDEDLSFAICYALNICANEMIHAHFPGKKKHASASKQTIATDQERFSTTLEKLCQNPPKFIDIIEFIYVCLNLQCGTKSNNPWQQTTDCLYQLVRSQRGEIEKRLSFLMPQVIHHPTTLKNKSIFFPIFEALLMTSLILFGMYSGTDYLFKLCSKQFSNDLQYVMKNVEIIDN